jgi:hypothetical protein
MSYLMGSTKTVISKLIKMVQSSCHPPLAGPFKTYFKKWYTGIPWYTSGKNLHVLAYSLVKTVLVIYSIVVSLYIHTIISNALLTILKASFTELFNGSIIHNSWSWPTIFQNVHIWEKQVDNVYGTHSSDRQTAPHSSSYKMSLCTGQVRNGDELAGVWART